MSELVARTGRHQQRYEDGYRLIAGEHGKLEKRIQSFIFICTWHFVTQRPTPQKSARVKEALYALSSMCVTILNFENLVSSLTSKMNHRECECPSHTLEEFLHAESTVDDTIWDILTVCIPFKYIYAENNGGDSSEMIVEVLMINSTSGPGLLFPKGGWENDETAEEAAVREAVEEAGVRGDLMHYLGCYSFKSKTLQDEYSPEGLCRASMYALYVEEELESWPEKSQRERSWLTIPEAIACCRHAWMQEAVEEGFLEWYADGMVRTLPEKSSS